jgi:hypothetical protein
MASHGTRLQGPDAPSYAEMRRVDGNMGPACEAAMELK